MGDKFQLSIKILYIKNPAEFNLFWDIIISYYKMNNISINLLIILNKKTS